MALSALDLRDHRLIRSVSRPDDGCWPAPTPWNEDARLLRNYEIEMGELALAWTCQSAFVDL